MRLRSQASNSYSLRLGFTVLEMTISVIVLAFLVGGISQAMRGMRDLSQFGNADSQLQIAGERAMSMIVDDLRRSGFVTPAASAYPYLFDNGVADPPYDVHAHVPAVQHAQAGDPDFGPNREIVFLQPQDNDTDDIPDLNANGFLIWGADEFSYVCITGVDGVNYLQRRINGGSTRTFATHVERVVFDDNTTSGFAVPIDAVRVRIWLRKTDARGFVHRHFVTATVKLRNGI